jgi:hypothetical protein
MKPALSLLFLAAWSLSLALAYYIGSRVPDNAASGNAAAGNEKLEKRMAGVRPAQAEPGPSTASGAMEKTTKNALEAYLNGETVPLKEAVLAVTALSAESSRSLLSDALALPTSDPNRSGLIEELLGQLAKTEPLAALEIASGIPSLRDSEDARVAILEVWGGNDPAAAIFWAQAALAGEPAPARSSQLSAIFRGYAAANPEGAFAEAMALNETVRLKNRLLGEVIEAQIQSGSPDVAKRSIDSITDPELREDLREDFIDEWAAFDPVAAGTYLESLGESATTELKTALVSEWAESDPVAAAAWLGALDPDDPAVARASEAIIREWTRYDLAASAEWLNSLPDSPELDRAVASYAYRAAEEDPEAAMTWAGSIQNDRRRSWMMERVAGTWKEQDAESFQIYLDAADFTEEQRERMENADSDGRGRWR